MLGEITLTGLTSQGAPNSQLHNWRVGQVLEAVALSKPSAERLQLRIDSVDLEARTQAPIQAGDRVLLKVLSTGSTPTLQVVPATVATGSAADIVNQALRQLLPRQLPTEGVLTNLLGILNQGQQRSQLPAQTRSLIETLLARIPRAEKLADHTRLRQLVTESGLFREQHQQQGRADRSADIKQSLMQLARQLRASQPAQGSVQPQVKGPMSGRQPAGASATASVGVSSAGVAGGLATAARVGTGSAAGVQSATVSTAASASGSPAAAATAAKVGSPGAVAGQAQPVIQNQAQHPSLARQIVDGARLAGDELYLQASSQSSLQELQRLVEGGIARIVMQQAQSLPQPNQDGARRVFELPCRQGDEYRSLPMVIEREAQGDDSDALPPGWQVELSFELPELGTIQARILVRGEKISASLWAERDTTAQLADAELTVLLANGLEVGALVCRQGHNQDRRSDGTSSLLDYRI